jgi:hypothetical protein
MFTQPNGEFSNSYAVAYDAHGAGRSLYDPLMDAFDFFDSLAPTLARRDSSGQIAHFPLRTARSSADGGICARRTPTTTRGFACRSADGRPGRLSTVERDRIWL